ncbi:MAG TPA: DUF4440 domain-containing protein [Pyrinomonadaceae bacterium]|jgi:ketosteroid isomerase-like protein
MRGTFLALLALVVALGAWLYPFSPVGPSPLANRPQARVVSASEVGQENKGAVNAFSESSEREQVINLLQDWVTRIREHDLDGHMAFYADAVDPFYKKGRYTSDQVRMELAPAFSKYSTLDIQLSSIDVNINYSQAQATATFRKTWAFRGEKTFSGSVRQIAWLVKRNGRWLISGIAEL